MFRRKPFDWVLVLFLALVVSGCEISKMPYSPRVYLEGQEDHSWITVRVVEADTFVFTASDGSYVLPPLGDGTWTLRASYPWYSTEEQRVVIEEGAVSQPIADMTLRREIVFEVQTDRASYRLGEKVQITLISKNLTGQAITLESVSASMDCYVVLRDREVIRGQLGPGPADMVDRREFRPWGADTTRRYWNTRAHPPPGPGEYKIYACLAPDLRIVNQDTTYYGYYFYRYGRHPSLGVPATITESLFPKIASVTIKIQG